MKLIIDIPKEFEEHFNKDRFSDSLARVASDIESFGVPLSGRYEQETITMLRKAFEDATPLEAQPTDAVSHGRLIDADAFKQYIREGMEEMKKYFKTDKGLELAIKTTESFLKDIDEQPSVEAQPSDAIRREAVLKLAEKGVLVSNGNYKSVINAINSLPSVRPQTVTEFADKCKECGKIQSELFADKRGAEDET